MLLRSGIAPCKLQFLRLSFSSVDMLLYVLGMELPLKLLLSAWNIFKKGASANSGGRGPDRLLLSTSRWRSRGNLDSSDGMLPLNELLFIWICFTLLKLANDLGMGPNNWFWSTCNLFKFWRLLISSGKMPESWLPFKSISLSVVIFPISFGMLPVKLFHIKSSVFSWDKRLTSGAKVPERFLLNNCNSVTWRNLSSFTLWQKTPVQFDLHGSPLFQFLRLFIGSTNLPLIALSALTSEGWELCPNATSKQGSSTTRITAQRAPPNFAIPPRKSATTCHIPNITISKTSIPWN